jgi:hypothetical protein
MTFSIQFLTETTSWMSQSKRDISKGFLKTTEHILRRIWQNDCLSFECTVTVTKWSSEKDKVVKHNPQLEIHIPPSKFQGDLGQLLE